MKAPTIQGIEVNPKMVGALFTDQVGNFTNVFCLYLNGDVIQFSLPLEGNLTSVAHLFKQLDMFEKCSSAIVDQIVRGRIYVQDQKGIWMYTVLATAGSINPSVDATIHNLPWKRVWSAGATEVLKLERRRGKKYCFAVRSQIAEAELAHALREAKAMVNPVVAAPPRVSPVRIGASIATAMALLLASLVGFRHFVHVELVKPMKVQARPMAQTVAGPKANYFLLVNHERSGPLSLDQVLELQKAGKLPGDTLVRTEQGVDWQPLEKLAGPKPEH